MMLGVPCVNCFTVLLCASDPCQNGADCQEIPEEDDYGCACPAGWGGKDCEHGKSVTEIKY